MIMIGLIGILLLVIIFISYRSSIVSKRRIICPNANCGFKGQGKLSGGKSFIVFVILFFFFILPGIIYMLLPNPQQVYCPKCGVRIR